MAERIIPIRIETDKDNEENNVSSDTEQVIAEPMEKLSIETSEPAAHAGTILKADMCKDYVHKFETSEPAAHAETEKTPKINKREDYLRGFETSEPAAHARTTPKINMHEDYLRGFDIFEDRSEYTLPNANVPEKLILVVDRAQDENFTPFLADGSKFTPLSMLKRAIDIFLNLKHLINKYNEFAVVILNENNTKWLLDFTSDIGKVKGVINKIEACEVEDTFDLNSLFDEIKKSITMPEVVDLDIPPSYLIRTVIFYGRSYTIPKIQFDDYLQDLLDNPYFICDVLFTHEPVDSSNHCNKIISELQNIDKKGLSYFFPVGRDSKRLHNCAAKLLGHPLQRPIQKIQKM